MSYAKALAVGLVGLAGHVVEVEADLATGLPGLTLTGLPDPAVSEARARVRAALTNSGEEWPNSRITVNLLPAALPKHGSVFDLAIATVVLAGAGMLPLAPLLGVVLLGELGLDGSVRPVRGVLPCVLAAARAEHDRRGAGAPHARAPQRERRSGRPRRDVPAGPVPRRVSHSAGIDAAAVGIRGQVSAQPGSRGRRWPHGRVASCVVE